ncbi:thioredoxin family protein [Pragia fontium]|uniref:Peroxiredoxin n=1 Tax=Pragia fontium DSM 5563 = ATCC 49100 TaxID=1122977 RepID=A0AAJ5BG63_9GAMM|nr:thioredoxin family protein [Pragia fontium]SFC19038.1 Peroxiredoxin [Pragia fontium DSM 5563 = ATCC 49100]VEJ53266.1 thiol-disulfide oxidoreductase [Pragia fontium]
MGFTLDIGQQAPNFTLAGANGIVYSLRDFTAPNIVIAFICNHCPMVKGTMTRIVKLANKYEQISFVAINSNDDSHYSSDAFHYMSSFADAWGMKFPYLYDKKQEVVQAYGAIRTPHFFVFNESRQLVYRGRLDDFPRDESLATTHELEDALNSLTLGEVISAPITEPKGCTVKWAGKDEHWLPEEYCDL